MIKIKVQPTNQSVNQMIYQAGNTEVWVMDESAFPLQLVTLKSYDKVKMVRYGQKVKLYKDGEFLGDYDKLSFWAVKNDQTFGLMTNGDSFSYFDHLEVKAGYTQLDLVNNLDIEDYVKGVIAAEAGHYKSLEFLKVQAVSSRTYAYKNLGKFAMQGYDLNDQVDCQRYKGAYNQHDLIKQAVDATKGLVIVDDSSNKLIDAVFHANSGGQTDNSEDVWVSSVSYLKSAKDDDYAKFSKNYSWTKTLAKNTFYAKLTNYYQTPVSTYTFVKSASGRVKYMLLNKQESLKLTGEEFRRVFGLKSAKVTITENAQQVVINGKGFGHGVGMCQDGAYYMSIKGLDFKKIITHYYSNVVIVGYEETRKKLQLLTQR